MVSFLSCGFVFLSLFFGNFLCKCLYFFMIMIWLLCFDIVGFGNPMGCGYGWIEGLHEQIWRIEGRYCDEG